MSKTIAFVGSTNLLSVTLNYKGSGAPINDAEVHVTVRDEDDVEVLPTSWPLDMPYVDDTDGVYRVELSYQDQLVAGECYVAEIVATTTNADPEKRLTKKFRFTAKEDIS